MIIQPKNTEVAREIVSKILIQGDIRYIDPENEYILADFLLNKGISLEKRKIPKTENDIKSNSKFIRSKVQLIYKLFAKDMLKREGFKEEEIYFERRFLGLRPDVFAEKGNKTILVECCSCKISKIIDFLSEVDEVWVITRGENPYYRDYISEEREWFVFKKGKKWGSEYKKYRKKIIGEIKNIKNTIDTLL